MAKIKGKKRSPSSDSPYLEGVDAGKNGKKKLKWHERPAPEDLSPNDAKILLHFRKRAYQWDMSFSCCCFGFRFGWSAIIGLIPLIGDCLEVLMAMSLVRSASKLDGGLPKRLYSMMITNIIIDFAAGFVPLLGDVIDMFYRCNMRNARLLDTYLVEKAKEIKKARMMRNPNAGEKSRAPQEMQFAQPDRDLEQGVEYVTPAALPPARTPAPKFGNVPPNTRPVTPGRSLTGQRTPGGRPPQDPRDR